MSDPLSNSYHLCPARHTQRLKVKSVKNNLNLTFVLAFVSDVQTVAAPLLLPKGLCSFGAAVYVSVPTDSI